VLADVEPHTKEQVVPAGLHQEEAAGAQDSLNFSSPREHPTQGLMLAGTQHRLASWFTGASRSSRR
ncbi:unnamed protein product, partial [Gulo gulo]